MKDNGDEPSDADGRIRAAAAEHYESLSPAEQAEFRRAVTSSPEFTRRQNRDLSARTVSRSRWAFVTLFVTASVIAETQLSAGLEATLRIGAIFALTCFPNLVAALPNQARYVPMMSLDRVIRPLYVLITGWLWVVAEVVMIAFEMTSP